MSDRERAAGGPVSSNEPSLIIIRGNSASGKTRVAHEVRARYGRGIAIVSQDVIRRDILQQRDDPGNPAIGLIDLTARYALNHGYHVIVEGILFSKTHGEMLLNLVRDHSGKSACFYYDLSFDETVKRHATKSQAAEYGPDLMRGWYRQSDLVPDLGEIVLDHQVTLDAAVSMMMDTASLHLDGEKEDL